MPGTDALDPQPAGGPTDRRRPAAVLYTVTVTSPVTGHVDTVEVPARCPEAAFPIACAWYPQLPLTGADVKVTAVDPEVRRGPIAA